MALLTELFLRWISFALQQLSENSLDNCSSLGGRTNCTLRLKLSLHCVVPDKARIEQSFNTVLNCLVAQPQCSDQLIDTHLTLIADERKNHEVSDFNMILLYQPRQRIIRLTE